MTPEGKVKKALKKWLDERGYYYFMPVPTGRGRRTVDFLVCMEGTFVAIEAKATHDAMVTALQDATLKKVASAGGNALVVYFDAKDELVFQSVKVKRTLDALRQGA
jgi:urease accessory protein UreE